MSKQSPSSTPRDSVASRRTGVTLFEAVLASALTAVVIGLISMSMSFYLKTVDERRKVIDETILARAVLRRFANDLRSAFDVTEVDTSGAQAAAEGGAGGGIPAGIGGPGDAGAGAEGDDAEFSDEELAELADASIPTSQLGLYGNSYELQIDISRTPRVGEFEIAELTGDMVQLQEILSDIKTVAYYVGGNGSTLEVTAVSSPSEEATAEATGLVRHTVSRDSVQFALVNGGVTFGTTEVLAPEVVAVEFQYFDGVEWLPEWDSMELGYLPRAVSITIAIDTLGTLSGEEVDSDVPAALADGNTYRLVVYLPASEFAAMVRKRN